MLGVRICRHNGIHSKSYDSQFTAVSVYLSYETLSLTSFDSSPVLILENYAVALSIPFAGETVTFRYLVTYRKHVREGDSQVKFRFWHHPTYFSDIVLSISCLHHR